ncbi:MAG: inositol monophosphatase [Candidatus Eisenbacteria bacterium]|uniref:Inositol-1-monophosphatase n=1 Tax=Eiseniibacteriota bacterium TaxID=2212470 RepID=A0A933SFB9_UNCEI|nr:inositol monophosphatase [Candidatus Eisenbacteria bacterium]
MTGPTPAALREAAERYAREAGALVREGYGRIHAPERKGRIDLVTEYDKRSEALLLERIARDWPGHGVLAEESGAHAAASGARVRWVLDPLDGTTNFAHNYPFFCVSVGVEVDGEPVAGAVFDPVADELFSAAKGEGATLNGSRIRVSACASLEDALLVTGFPYDVREHPERHLPLFQAFLLRAQGIRRDGSAALNLCYLAMGRFDGFWEGSLSAWDVCAGSLIVREAGGTITDYAGGAFRIDARQVCAGGPALHAQLLAVLREHPQAHLKPGA